MFNSFKLHNNRLLHFDNFSPEIIKKAIWIDIIDIKDDECHKIHKMMDTNLKNLDESSKFLVNDDGININSLCFDENNTKNIIITLYIKNNRIYTLRKKELSIFNLYWKKISRKKFVEDNKGNVYELLLDFFETKIEQLLNEIEKNSSNLELLTFTIINSNLYKKNEYNNLFKILTKLENISWKINLCIIDTKISLKFLLNILPTNKLSKAREILQYTESIFSNNESVLQKINFLMQTAMGFINIEQNKIIKIFSVISVVFLPPTLVASSYGMNFTFMPELKWPLGYPLAIILMILAGLAPYLYFKRKKWL